MSGFDHIAIGTLVSSIERWSPDEETSPSFRYVDIGSIDSELKKIKGAPETPTSSAPSRARQLLEEGDVLVSTVRPNLNAVARVDARFDGTIGSTGFCVLRPVVSRLDSSYLFHWTRTPEFIRDMSAKATGQSYPAVSDRVVKESSIPLPMKDGEPDLTEQRRIAAILDKADALRRKAQQALDLTDDLIRSTFLDMFGDPVTNPKGWREVTIRDLVVEAKYGSSQKAGAEGRWPMLRMNNITYSGGWDFSELKYLDLQDKDIAKYTVRAGDLLFNRTNSKELVGKTAVYRGEKPMAFAGYLIRVRANEEADTEYISAYLNTGHGKATLTGMCKAIIGMANINAQELQSIPILKPPVALQREFAKIVRAIDAKRENPKRVIQATEALFNSCLQRAFTGGL